MTATRPGPPKKSVSPPGKPKPDQKQPPTPTPASPRWRWMIPAAIAIALFAVLLYHPGSGTRPTALSYTSFVGDVTANKVTTASITSVGAVSGTLKGGSSYTSQIPVALDDTSLSSLLLGHQVQVTGTSPSSGSVLGFVIEWILPLAIIIGLFLWFARRSSKQLGGRLGGLMAFGKSKAKVYDEDKPKTWRWWTS
jgi:cell division protease FtsH